jgi:sugar lactone lactonase YvrE
VRTRASCRQAGGRAVYYRIDSLDIDTVFNAHGIAVAEDGTVFFPASHATNLYAVRPGGDLEVVGASPVNAGSGFSGAYGIAVDASGDVHGAFRYAHKVGRMTGIPETLAGSGVGGSHGGDGGLATAARLNAPNGIAIDDRGNTYVTDSGLLGFGLAGSPLTGEYVRVIEPTGRIDTIVGSGTIGVAGIGGSAVDAQLSLPYALAFSPPGSVLIGEAGAQRVVEVEPGGRLVPVAGRALSIIGAYSGDGGPAPDARLFGAEGLAEDRDGKLGISDFRNGRIRLVDRLGSIITIAGTGEASSIGGDDGDGVPGVFARAGCAGGLAVDAQGRFYYPDLQSDRLRVLTPVPFSTQGGARQEETE